ncbi:MAG: putative metal-dependent hydrolase [Verrucomicrobiales bacterium]|nr:putative metal-dependent hydrolase [Verrucomicrobiales bacterium]
MTTSYDLRISPKARNVYLRFSIQGGLQVVVPRGYNLTRIPQLLERKKKWIERTERRLTEYRNKLQTEPIEKLPPQILLTALGETWSVQYVETESRLLRLQEGENRTLTLSGNIKSELACKRALRKWLCRRGCESLVPWLRCVSQETNLLFEKASVRIQRSRWGSCSRRKTISLNAKLLFLRADLVRYLFIHELCHLVHMNHSPRYWQFVAIKEPNYKLLDSEMRNAMRLIPHWV